MIQLILSIFGLVVGVRTLSFLAENNLLVLKMSQKLILISIFVLLSRFLSNFLLWIIVWIFLFSPFLVVRTQVYIRNKILDNEIPVILDILIVEMKSGRSFSEALKSYLSSLEGYSKVALSELLLNTANKKELVFRNLSSDIKGFFCDLYKIEQSSSRVIDRLVALRGKIKTQRHFRTKINRALLQARAQAIVLSLLYLVLAIYSIFIIDWSVLKPFLFGSMVLFFVGITVLHRTGRAFKWKV